MQAELGAYMCSKERSGWSSCSERHLVQGCESECREAQAAADGLKAAASDFRLCVYEITQAYYCTSLTWTCAPNSSISLIMQMHASWDQVLVNVSEALPTQVLCNLHMLALMMTSSRAEACKDKQAVLTSQPQKKQRCFSLANIMLWRGRHT